MWCSRGLRRVLGGTIVMAAMAASLVGTAGPAAAAPGYLTLMFAHSAWTLTENCAPVTTGVMTPDRIASDFHTRGLTPTGTVITGWVRDTTRYCVEPLQLTPVTKPIQTASWTDLTTLATSGWRFISHSETYADMTALTTEEQRQEACGSLATLRDKGHPEAAALFAYPNNRLTAAINSNVVLPCGYTLGRKYGSTANTASSLRSSHLLITASINGGACNISTLPCYNLPTRYRYTAPSKVASFMQASPGTWRAVQVYRLVTGSKLTGNSQWDCTATDWRKHWTAGVDPTELYCWQDYRYALDRIPAGVVTTDPATVERAWAL